MQVCTSLQTDNHASTPPLSFLQAGCPSCRPTNSVKALKALLLTVIKLITLLLWSGHYLWIYAEFEIIWFHLSFKGLVIDFLI